MSTAILEKIELNRVHQMDALEGMRLIPSKSVDLIVIDPPYNIGKDARWDKWRTVDDYVTFMTEVFRECERVLKPNGSFYWFHNDFLQIVELQNAINEHTSFVFKQFIVWNKRFNGAKNKGFLDGFIEVEHLRNYQQMAEYCLFYTFQDSTGLQQVMLDVNNFHNLRKYFADLQKHIGMSKKEIIDRIGQRADHCFRSNSPQWSLPTRETYQAIVNEFDIQEFKEYRTYDSLINEFEELRVGYEVLRKKYESDRYTFNNQKTHHSVWDYDIAAKLGHVTPKPLDLIENIIRHSSNDGDVVLDCFLGSGTTAVAAINTNRNFIGIERETEYVDFANDRIAQALKEAV